MSGSNTKIENACVVVLGDIGRSPRMQYHVKSLSETRYFIDLIGYVETQPLDDLTNNSHVRIHPLTPFPELNLPTPVKYIFKTMWQALTLLMALISIEKPRFILCQNPPAIPTIIVCQIYSFFARSTKLIIDWHNYTHTILAINSSQNSIIVKLAKIIESYFGRKVYANLCVTKAMKKDLEENFNVRSTVLYDRPPMQFQPSSIKEKHELFMRLSSVIPIFKGSESDRMDIEDFSESSAFTIKHCDGQITLKPGRSAILISSTSWTPDEDFELLLAALEIYEKEATGNELYYPHLVCIITGKGPLKEHYISLINKKVWKKVTVVTPWLEHNDYPKLLSASDLGVCLHYSSSGLDLPMKIVDMFGAGLPVCAINFQCLEELVRHGENGFVFENASELAALICTWFQNFPNNIAIINQKEVINQNLTKFQQLRWSENWKKHVQSILNRL
ncbi:chitobiosyldiphosphodolichol beta-mannosyltransferase [Wyeomyia smithii]|uniref:chitobiosyldiphosphodolichol beta-mannosyltransferase n=1 Tax=Wyeomyia smithii TaxID=174621 RepID=UPI002467CA72|nr:chitobiosyldiphosphodolichol beta-mannosyltransferase [Wyeomyia smithii]XP_055550583.1 chitobiosyldiphosphodolichol beta-mannosyltransferase [Wyeomyia smithii]XP_055550584.1 chitobiosyldiphosphodolichol beta-mannosyltransferase [Wyeomyia smithii]